ncbi:MotA/TolQ/ExbB proton channel family protein [Haliea sp.]|jgi:biopolymer transport protein ExbB|uniref:MotA/TolQ/ExbB proton channel family protein n=1 Tax=Haliea TaxID=475794 RepID=UPI000C3F0444|nr:MotA/TolQ/ExbB proton channel family protein [Haliea sp.]HBX72434.1 biopolymer transporter ExbB [Halieaceae bacterium]MAD64069.1 biopolymer transporter ExbB [Haliea sp.]MAY92474.1 biopolymer transporter ExbB [Haliea sp.]MBK40898.1 biopolymer transporter ExbB [Haliea sp.]MBP68527.1 biopolymer transporter ExbB [Haliea sp.]|tara:strand:+ start:2725 stop:3246 length:522 start_codon:yes stop_codon:yes gene_type:complete
MSGGIIEGTLAFMDKGGDVLWLIAILVFVMWTLIFERLWYFTFAWRKEAFAIINTWEARSERKSWNAKQIRARLLSRSREAINANLPVITTMVALCPLLGLLGTVTGMIEVFNVMAVTGGGDAKSMAGGVERSTIPTMAGMVAALSGLFANTYLNRVATREQEFLQDNLTSDH